MVSTNIRDYGAELLAQHAIQMSRIDDAVRRILRVKFRAGLFDHPYVDQAKAVAPTSFVTADDRAAARSAADRSMVLLKNDGGTLPLDPTKSVAVIGPLGNDQHDMLGPWWGQGEDTDAVSVFDGIKAQDPNTTFSQGCTIRTRTRRTTRRRTSAARPTSSRRQSPPRTPPTRSCSPSARAGDERRGCRPQRDRPSRLPAAAHRCDQGDGQALRRRALQWSSADAGERRRPSPAILEAWFPGIEAGNAVADALFGKVNPGGKLPVSFPRSLGQIPIYYNHEPTGRPCDVTSKYNSRYRDLASCDPLYAFGFGLSYTTFSVTNLRLDTSTVPENGKVTASVDVTNTGSRAGDDVVQLYIHDPVASIEQPVRRLRGFQRVTLAPGDKQTVSFTLDKSDFGFYDNRGQFVVEPGEIDVYAGDSSAASLEQSFTVTG